MNAPTKTNASEAVSATDVKQISQVISALSLLKMNIGIYPEDHISVDQSADMAYTLLRGYFRKKPELTLGVTGKTLLFNETVLDKNNKNFQEYAHILHNFHVLFLKLKNAVTKQELLAFSKILSAKPSEIRYMANLETLLAQSAIKGIEVRTIDAGYFQLSEEKKTRRENREEDVWQDFIAQMRFDDVKMELRYDTPSPLDNANFAALIKLLNDNPQAWTNTVSGYEGMTGNDPDERQTGVPASAEKHEILGVIANLIHHFHPDLQDQLLRAAQTQAAHAPQTDGALENQGYLPDNMLPVMIHLANEGQRQIPPPFLMLLKQLSAIGQSASEPAKDSRQRLSAREIENILKKEKYEEYIPEKYERLLKKLSLDAAAENPSETDFPLSEYLKSLDDENIDFSISQLLLALMEEESDENLYAAYCQRLPLFVPALLQSGQFSFLIGLIETLRRHTSQSVSENIRRQATNVLATLSDPETIAPHITPALLQGKDTADAAKFLFLSGEQNIPWLFDLYLDDTTAAGETLIAILKTFGDKAVEEAHKRMSQKTPLSTLHMMNFLREVSNERTIPVLKQLYRQDDYRVKKEALEILLSCNQQDAVDLLARSLRSPRHQEIQQAASLTIHFKITSLMGELMSLLKTWVIREKDTILNELIVRQLGGSGSAWAIPYLERIAGVRLSFSPRRLLQMKKILYESLENFPQQEVQFLLEKGSKSFNRNIRERCLKIMAQRES